MSQGKEKALARKLGEKSYSSGFAEQITAMVTIRCQRGVHTHLLTSLQTKNENGVSFS